MAGKILKVASNDLYGNVDDRIASVYACFEHTKYMNNYVIFTINNNIENLYYGSIHIKNKSVVIFSVKEEIKKYIDQFLNEYMSDKLTEFKLLDISKIEKVELVSYNEMKYNNILMLDNKSIPKVEVKEEVDIKKKKPVLLYFLLFLLFLLGVGLTILYLKPELFTVKYKGLKCESNLFDNKLELYYGIEKDIKFDTDNKVDNISVSGISGEEMEKLARIEVQNGEFKSGDGLKLLDTSKITDSVLYGFNLFNYFKTEKKADVFMGVYYGGKLAGIKTLSVTVPAKSKSDTLSLGFADGLPDGDKTDISVKVLVWEKDTFVPYTDRIDMYSQSDRAVIPEVFGKDAEGQTIVAFMGDSITHLNPSYTKWIEYYYRIKYPTKDIKFVSKGISGDSAGGNLSRFDWDIYSGAGTSIPTEACLMIGMNDVNRSLYPDGSEENKQTAIDNCLANIEAIADKCAEKGIKLTLITPTLYDEADYTSVACNTGVNAGLGKIAERVIKLANEKNLAYIDFYGYINSFNSALRSDSGFAKSTLFNLYADRIHATPAGTFAEGFIFIDQQINDYVIASVDIDASELDVVTESATVTDIANENGILSYTYLPASLPMYMTDEYTLCNDTYGIPVTDSINREIIKVSGLEDGNYKIMFDDAEIGIYTAAQLAEGVNIATAATNPGYVKSQEVYDLVSQKMAKDYVLREIAFVERWLYSAGIDLTNVQACINYVENTVKNGSNYESNKTRVDNYANYKTNQAATIEEIAELEKQAKQAAQPEIINVQIIKEE